MGRDDAGEPENKKTKNCGGITWNWNYSAAKKSPQGSYNLKKYFITVDQLGNNFFDEFFKERMQPQNEKTICDPTENIKIFTSQKISKHLLRLIIH